MLASSTVQHYMLKIFLIINGYLTFLWIKFFACGVQYCMLLGNIAYLHVTSLSVENCVAGTTTFGKCSDLIVYGVHRFSGLLAAEKWNTLYSID